MHTGLPAPGEMVWIRRQRWRIEHARRDRSVVRLEVANRDRRLTFLAPFDRPSIAQDGERLRYTRPQSARARIAYALSRAHGVRSVAAAVDARLTILAYQLEPALALIHGARRVLVADEVGLGKTIQAGLAIAECVRRRTTARVLVLVPAALRDQWIEELDTRFALASLRADRHQLDALARSGARASNPWTRPGVWIASLDFLKQRHVVDALPFDPWDLVVVDEAHAACGDSERHAACDTIARRSRALLMLTATPHDGDQDRFTRLLDLGVLPSAGDDLVILRRTRALLNAGTRRVVRWQTIALSASEDRLFRALQDFERVVLSAARRDEREATILLLSVLRKRALSTVSALVVSLQRRLAWLDGPTRTDGHAWLQPRLGFDRADLTGAERLDEDDDGDREALMRMIGLGAAQERAWLRRLLVLAEPVRRRESKIERLARLLRRSREPAIVFTEFRHSLAAIASRLQHERPLAVLHGGQDSGERRRELQRFVDGRVSLLLATDVASLGLNLQHRARWVINLELPWNPARLEQRAGRVDRLGQTRAVHVSLLVGRHDAESPVLRRLARRTLSAQRSFGGDLLDGVLPAEAAVRSAVFTGGEIADVDPAEPAPHAIQVPISRAWERAGRVVARGLERQRLLARQWRAPAPEGGPRWTCGPRILPAFTGNGALLIFSVPLVDRTGVLLERRVVAISVDEWPRLARDRGGMMDVVRQAAARALARRARRLEDWLRPRDAAAVTRERLIAAGIAKDHRPGEGQPGLFDARAERALEMARDTVAYATGRAEERADLLSKPRGVVVGRPQLLLVLEK